MSAIRKILQYIKICFLGVPPILYHHFRYNIRFCKHPEKYPIEYRFSIIRKEIRRVLRAYGVRDNLYNIDEYNNIKENSLVICNHISDIDPMYLIAKSEKPIAFVAKKEIISMPFVGKVMKSIDVYALDRDNLMSQVNVIKDVVRRLKDKEHGSSVVVFPEGTRNRHAENPCLEFKAGTIKIAAMANVPIVPLSIYGSSRLLSLRSYLHHYPIFLHVGDKVDPSEYEKYTSAELADKLQKQIDLKVDELRAIDKEFIYKSHVSKRRKVLETIVDARANS